MTLLRAGSATDTGLVRAVNQDLALQTTSLFAVADGMGGHVAGEVAARTAIETLATVFRTQPNPDGLVGAVEAANREVWQQGFDNADLRGMGTTVTAVALVEEDGHDILALVNVGDSRTYRFHDGHLDLLTLDHSLAEEMVRNGEITAEEAAVHPHRHILTRALGVAEDIKVDLWRVQPIKGDRFLLCSDGLTNELDDAVITDMLATIRHPQDAANQLVEAARNHGGNDNITVVVIDVVMGDEVDEEQSAGLVVPSEEVLEAEAAAEARAHRQAEAHAEAEAQAQAAAGPTGPGEEPLLPTGESVGQPDALVAPVGAPVLSRRAERRIKRRNRRIARGRRLVTLRTFLFLILAAAIIGAGYFAVRWYDTNSYYVGVDQGHVVIYQGRIGGFLWFHPKAVDHTGVTVFQVPATYIPALQAGVEETSVANAQAYVRNLEQQQRELQATAANPAVTSPLVPGTPTTTTTTMAGVG